MQGSSGKFCHAKKRIHDAPFAAVLDPKKTCFAEDGRDEISVKDVARELQNQQWLFEFQRRKLTVLDMITLSGSIDDFLQFLVYLFETDRVETLALDLIKDFWEQFPEEARSQLGLFRQYCCWQQLLLLLRRSQRIGRTGDEILRAGLALLKDQWRCDIEAFKEEKGVISDLALWLPREGQMFDRQLHFVRLFSRLVAPKSKSFQAAKDQYEEQLNDLRNHVMEKLQQRRCSLTHDHKSMIHVVSSNSFDTDSFREAKQKESERSILPYVRNLLFTRSPLFFSPDGSEESNSLLLPIDGRVDYYLYLQSSFRTASEEFLKKEARVFDSSSSERVLYIHQGEIGFAVPSQCDVIVSDKATTCHLLSIRSSSTPYETAPPLTSLAHIDGSFYTECLQDMIGTHIQHHCNGHPSIHRSKISLLLDIVGGFDDHRGASAEISSWLIQTLAYLAEDYQSLLTMTIRTCAISCINDDGGQNPIGRGLAIYLRTGEAYLAKAESTVTGPASQLRSARIWAGGGNGRLSVVHSAENEGFTIQPFHFGVFDKLDEYLRLPDRIMIRRTSTSPDAEEPDFCAAVRRTLRFMKEVRCQNVFGEKLDRSVAYFRVGSSNVWKRG